MYHIFTRGFSGLFCLAFNRRFARERRAEDDGGDVEDVRETRGVESDGACATRRVDATSERDKGTRREVGLEWIGTRSIGDSSVVRASTYRTATDARR